MNLLEDTTQINRSTNSYLAHTLSFILHPSLMTVYAVALLFIYTDFRFMFISQVLIFIAPVFILGCLIPTSILYLLKKNGTIDDYNLAINKERGATFWIFFISYILLFYIFFEINISPWFKSLLFIPILLLLIVSVIKTKWNISTHMVAIGALIGATLGICYIKGLNPIELFIFLIILAGSLGVSRLVLNKDTPLQIYIGFVLGAVLSYLIIIIGVYLPFLMLIINH